MGALDSIIANVRKHQDVFDFTKETLGESLCHISAMAIIAYMGAEMDPDGQPWAPLSDAYAEWKADHFGGQPMAVLHRAMRTLDQVEGLYRITATTIDQTYGTDEQARAEAEWFQEGNDRQPARRFYAFNDQAINDVTAWLDQHFAAAFA